VDSRSVIVTQLLEKALAEIHKLSESQQDALASMILEELADERLWEESFARSQDQMAKLAEKARQDIRAGRVRNIGIDEL
jgi:aspartate/glutamate racemase